MGLDMYLEKRQRMNKEKIIELSELFDNNYDTKEVEQLYFIAKQSTKLGEVIGQFNGFNVYARGSEYYKYPSLSIEIGYWRKANHIHKWFVDNVQNGIDDCNDYEVSEEQLLKLKENCEAVLLDSTKAKKLLPTESGFFFGCVDYDEYYFEHVERTIEIIDSALAVTNFKTDMITYCSSW